MHTDDLVQLLYYKSMSLTWIVERCATANSEKNLTNALCHSKVA